VVSTDVALWAIEKIPFHGAESSHFTVPVWEG
jgi:hypothetical protein